MAHHTRAFIIAVFVMLTATVSAYINFFLTLIQVFYATTKLSIYAPGASIITNLITSSLVSEPVTQVKLAALTDEQPRAAGAP